jgi:hypothetical protein
VLRILSTQSDDRGSLPDAQGIREAIAKTIQTEGISGLYSGLSSSLFGIAVTNGVYYAFCTWM